MTFIIAIQATDSIIITSDRTAFTMSKAGEVIVQPNKSIIKMRVWGKNILSAVGDHNIFEEIYKDIHKADFKSLSSPEYLRQLCSKRKLLTGVLKPIDDTKMIYSQIVKDRPKIYILSCDELEPMMDNEIQILCFNSDISSIVSHLGSLQRDIHSRNKFLSEKQWIKFYLSKLIDIYKEQSQCDSTVSQEFDIFFQSNQESLMIGFEDFKKYLT